MSYRQISQKEARFLKKRVAELEAQRRSSLTVFGGVNLGHRKLDTENWLFGRLQTARRLGFALVITVDDSGDLNYYAVKK